MLLERCPPRHCHGWPIVALRNAPLTKPLLLSNTIPWKLKAVRALNLGRPGHEGVLLTLSPLFPIVAQPNLPPTWSFVFKKAQDWTCHDASSENCA